MEKPNLQLEKPRIDLPLAIKEAEVPSARPNEKFERYVEEFAALPASASSFEETTGDAVALVFFGRAREAVDVLRALEQNRPGVYTTATNLDTAYE